MLGPRLLADALQFRRSRRCGGTSCLPLNGRRDEGRQLLRNPATYQVNNMISHSQRILMHIKYYEGTHDSSASTVTMLRGGRHRIRGLVPGSARYLISDSAARHFTMYT